MRKSVLTPSPSELRSSLDAWLDLDKVAAVELTSEDPAHPFEQALRGEGGEGWKAAAPGPQTIRVLFDEPRPIHRIRLEFRETTRERSQEFSLSAISAGHQAQPIVRQQWTFSPGGSTTEAEDYAVSLLDIVAIELTIDPGRHDLQAVATLQSMAIA
jgi:hypothetical protein